MLQTVVKEYYQDLLTAIYERNFDRLEILCEGELTEALAACIYEQTVIQNNRFEIQKAKEEVYDITVVNHFHVHNVKVERALNNHMKIKDYVMEEKGPNLHFTMKPRQQNLVNWDKQHKSLT